MVISLLLDLGIIIDQVKLQSFIYKYIIRCYNITHQRIAQQFKPPGSYFLPTKGKTHSLNSHFQYSPVKNESYREKTGIRLYINATCLLHFLVFGL